MKRLTDERIAALIDIAPLSKTIVDIKTALIELQERRKAAGEQAGLFIRVNDMFFQVAAAGDDCDETLRDQAIPLYMELQPVPVAPVPDEMTVEAAYAEVQFKEAALAKIISTAGKDPSEITDAVWAAGYRKPERTEEEAINLAIDTFTDSRYYGIPEDVWPKTYDEILQCELNEILNEELWRDIPPDVIANRLIGEGYRKEEP